MEISIKTNTAETPTLIRFYEQMFLIRYFENKLEELFKKGELFGTVHGCIGQEAVAVGVISALSKDDIIVGNHRSHGHFIAYTKDVEGLMAEIMGKAVGVVGGRGGSQHLQKENFYSNGVQGNLVPVATGMALAEKLKKTNNIVICFIGDGTLGQGVIYEAMNMASLWNLPIAYILENNFYAMSTRVENAVAGSILGRGKAFDIEGTETAGNDIQAIYNQANIIFKKIRDNCRPYLWVITTYRLCGHSKGDDRCYRSKEEEKKWQKKDPLFAAKANIGEDMVKNIEEKCKKIIEETYKKLKNANFPSTENI